MTSAHRLLITVGNMGDATEATAVAVGTKFLLNDVPDVSVIHEASAKPWKGTKQVQFIVSLTDEQLQAVKDAEDVTHLEEV